MSKTVAVFSSALLCLLFASTASLRAQGTPPPDFTGVYSPIDPFGQAGRGRAAVPPPAAGTRGEVPPPRPVLVLDGRAGRPDNAPKLTPEYLAKWEVIRKSRMAGSDEFDPNARCLSAGMPNMMSMTYGMEIQHTKDKVTIYGELNDVYRRIFWTAASRRRKSSTIRRSPGTPRDIGKGTRSSWTPWRFVRTRCSTRSRRTAISSPCASASGSRRLASSRIGSR